jgi:23S rRNA (pseudouridine1915-N3)-methyltransferase
VHLRLIAVGDRQPAWVDQAFAAYAGRFPRDWKFHLEVLSMARRSKSDKSNRARDAESADILAKIRTDEYVVLLDERGRQFTSQELSGRLENWQQAGRDLCFVIGGPDGVGGTLNSRADLAWSLSKLTLPHGLARVLFAEQMYRAWSLKSGHPYHRE